MFVPIDLLPPILADLITDGRVSGPGGRGSASARESARPAGGRPRGAGQPGREGRPQARRHHRRRGGEEPPTLADFYRKIWAQGAAGATIPLDVLQNDEKRQIDVKSMNRLDHLKLKSTF